MILVRYWRHALGWYSVQALITGCVLNVIGGSTVLASGGKLWGIGWGAFALGAVICTVGVLGRLIYQPAECPITSRQSGRI